MASQKLIENVVKVGAPHILLGIDPNVEKIPAFYIKKYRNFVKAIEEWVKDLLLVCHNEVVGVKFQSAFFEFLGSEGIKLCNELMKFASEEYKYFVVLDAKRNDIPEISKVYAETYLVNDWIDGITTTPFFGVDSLEVLLEKATKNNKYVFVVIFSSNKGAIDFQRVKVEESEFWEYVLNKLYGLYKENNSLGFVVGATYPQAVRKVQDLFPEGWIISPGFGPQGAETSAWKKAYLKPVKNILFNLSRALTIPDNPAYYTQRDSYLKFVKNKIEEWKNILSILYKVM
jgi:orotidine-5'-phosphate decarboxylase